jgi:hypothetical protein
VAALNQRNALWLLAHFVGDLHPSLCVGNQPCAPALLEQALAPL